MRDSRRAIEQQLKAAQKGVEEPRGAEPSDIAWRGIELCRQGDWKEGLYWLSLAARTGAKERSDSKDASDRRSSRDRKSDLPALFYSYLGYGIAKYQRQQQQGVKLCQRAIELEFYQPESYYFLARTHLLLKDRRAAVEIVDRGLQVDSTHEWLTELRAELGERLPPVLSFLPRGHLLNRWLGKARHRLLRRHKTQGRPGKSLE